MTQIVRFAPSPNGLLHLGHAFSALLNAARARETGGRFLLRIEDIDVSRCRPAYEAAISEDLAWLGLAWETPVRRQSEHFSDYRAALATLDALGVLYPAFESRAEIARLVAAREAAGPWPRDPDGAPLYPGDAKAMPPPERAARIARGEPHVLRLDLSAALARLGPAAETLAFEERGEGPDGETGRVPARPEAWGDVVVARKDVPASYHLAVVVDDAAQGVTEVVRGRDLFAATSIHRVLQALLGLPAPAYRHHRLILDAEGRKLSKSTRATGLSELRAAGLTPADVRRLIEPIAAPAHP
ncbi:tRNA glutamyl-Q(34) synthetase GluQRS [Rhodoplanes sp. TEM]|uniref:tRNA glutamyl-Q(34) synthetase GluQRS n=1 Tax=Rhodoplanes tepidamans TaxID=200616 RepID=A0ABT5JF54_RHOTP|nr:MULTISPECIES: tRNA glutamyl-Q(34) synthetase GluQRS [Rhodoplanes]MDC7788261.1 tRNA glutamyl-Q(34) synthetase GluQRS [Rhodoplanes tepidamans]MDC7982934.1 tRNA glutamyl-Q(34) synthetase GluQRS [Rhodoplanes sp. TEM]MDQ0355870.1 glutamyl-Q tRNA(Asp) synthetase [Rhodoplanes tepidamans]